LFQKQNNEDLPRISFTVLSHTDLRRQSGKSGDIDLAAITWGNYDFVVIDESHNFRSNTKGRTDEDGQLIRMSHLRAAHDANSTAARKNQGAVGAVARFSASQSGPCRIKYKTSSLNPIRPTLSRL